MANKASVSDQNRTIPDKPALATRIARLKPCEEKSWLFDEDEVHASGLRTHAKPFYVEREHGPGYEQLDTWSVMVLAKKGSLDSVLFSGLPDFFAAYRLMIDAVEAWQAVRPMERVYFIGSTLARGKPIKVGYSRDPEARLRTLQTASSETLRIFATVPGGVELERKYHTRWRARRTSGEWFTIGDCILAEIARLQPLRSD